MVLAYLDHELSLYETGSKKKDYTAPLNVQIMFSVVPSCCQYYTDFSFYPTRNLKIQSVRQKLLSVQAWV